MSEHGTSARPAPEPGLNGVRGMGKVPDAATLVAAVGVSSVGGVSGTSSPTQSTPSAHGSR